MTDDLARKLESLRAELHQLDSALIAYSGGVDSALLMALAHQELGERMLACIAVSPSFPQRELQAARQLAERLSIPYRLVDTQEHANPAYAANAPDRCYHCKTEMYGRLRAIAAAEGWGIILDGTNASDLGDFRPGMLAGDQHGVRSPLLEAGIGKEEVRALARQLGLPVWDKPATPCLASRVPHGTAVSPELLAQIEAAEDVLAGLGFRQFRVRHHGDVARIELPVEDLVRAVSQHERIVAGLQAAGFRFVAIDLGGLRSGSLNGSQPPADLKTPIPLLDGAPP
jgi:uncharacterized protein